MMDDQHKVFKEWHDSLTAEELWDIGLRDDPYKHWMWLAWQEATKRAANTGLIALPVVDCMKDDE